MLKSILNLFFPPICTGCKTLLLSNEKIICTHCRHEIPLTHHHLIKENEAFKKFYGRIDIEHASALYYFHKKGIVQELIHNLKYRGHEEIGTMIGEWYLDDLKKIPLLTTAHAIIPVPLHPKKLKTRGYNQVSQFGKTLSKGLKIPYKEDILFRKTHNKTQSKKNLISRTENIENIFDVHYSENEHQNHFILIDDILTTGATLEACCRALQKIPEAKISIVCMAMAQS
ncbi:ComF family protein [Flavobacterium sp. UMI-01]|uniref:ComF family protein n=1 Tax=Flavobacterium sp. UMI-01 TaxID=1441053 RepID=UPI001C7D38E5|nr:phosphoribosyltransferase family protein [Flavobacterium sp. UMI-01]GIZ07953.1 amidophosphoribosyltransferase [Flavobacterium sp. UMI-01]